MSEKSVTYIFHLGRKSGKPVFYHPFKANQEFIAQVSEAKIEGKYGEDPRVESVTLLRNDLYRKTEGAVKLWVTDTRFIPRFLLSSLVFIISYFFALYVVRVPVPFFYKLFAAVAVSLFTYSWIGKRYLNSDSVVEKRLELRTVIDGITFSESEFMKKIEGILAYYDGASLEELLKVYGDPQKLVLDPSWVEEAKSLEHYLAAHFNTKTIKDFERKLQRKVTIEATKPIESLKKIIEAGKIDFPLYLLHILLKKSV